VQQGLGRIGAQPGREFAPDRVQLAQEERPEQGLLGPPVQVEGPGADTGPRGDVVDGDPRVAPPQERVGGGVQDSVRPLRPIAARSDRLPARRRSVR
jgi:hypothetical protein